MVFYFSGTGNSQLVAVRIAEMTGDKAVSINYDFIFQRHWKQSVCCG